MAWTAPRTWVTSEVVTSTIMNAHVRDNLLETAPAKASAKGDLFAATAANAISRLAIGSNGQTLIPNSACNNGVQWTGVLATTISSGSKRSVVTTDYGGVYVGETITSASRLSVDLIAASGRDTWIRYVESGVNNNWMIGTLAGDFDLILATGFPGASTFRYQFNSGGGFISTMDSTNEAAEFRGTSISHGVTTYGHHTSTYLKIEAAANTQGGVNAWAYTTSTTAFTLATIPTNTDTSKATTSIGAINLNANLKSGAGTTFMTANSNLLTLNNYSTTRFIFDADGDLHADAGVSASAYDLWDDAHLSRALMTEIGGKNIVRSEFDGFLKYNRRHLQELGIATFNDGPDGDGSVFVNWMQFSRVLAGAAWQTAACLMRLERDIETRVAELTDRLDGMTRVLTSGSGLQEWGAAT